jgi:hypothetical protein
MEANPGLTREINADHADAAIAGFLESVGRCSDDSREHDLIDLLDSMRHYAAHYGIDFDKAVKSSLQEYQRTPRD